MLRNEYVWPLRLGSKGDEIFYVPSEANNEKDNHITFSHANIVVEKSDGKEKTFYGSVSRDKKKNLFRINHFLDLNCILPTRICDDYIEDIDRDLVEISNSYEDNEYISVAVFVEDSSQWNRARIISYSVTHFSSKVELQKVFGKNSQSHLNIEEPGLELTVPCMMVVIS